MNLMPSERLGRGKVIELVTILRQTANQLTDLVSEGEPLSSKDRAAIDCTTTDLETLLWETRDDQ